jgi:tetratricopeptide (TPR) repeat protein
MSTDVICESLSGTATSVAARSGLLLALMLAVVALTYAGVLSGDFVWDDHPLIEGQPLVQELQSLSVYFGRGFWFDPTHPLPHSFYRPLVTLSYALEWQLWGGRATGFHATNLFLHLVCCVLVFQLARRAGASAFAAAFGAALFGTLPRLSESVAWISGRTDVLASVGSLGAVLVYRSDPAARGRRIAAGGLVLLGLLSKEVALASVLAIVVLEIGSHDETPRPWRRIAEHLLPVGLAVATYAVLRARAVVPPAAGLEQHEFGALQHLLWFPLQALGHYAILLVDPLRPQTQVGALGLVEPTVVVVGAVVGSGVVALGIWAWRGRRAGLRMALGCLAVAAILPVLHVIPLPMKAVAADRYLYLTAAALFALGAAWASSGPIVAKRVQVLAGAAAAMVLLSFVVTTHRRAPVWGDDLRLWQDAVLDAPRGNSLPSVQLGNTLARRGRPSEAIIRYRHALAVDSEFTIRGSGAVEPRLLANLGLALSEVGEHDEARALLARVVELRPSFAVYRLDLAAVQARALAFEEAEASLLGALEMVDEFPDAARLLEQVRSARSRWQALPPPVEGEPLDIVAERATVYTLVGRIEDADRSWATVVASPQATPQLLVPAAVHLATNGRDPGAARRAFARLRREGAPEERVAKLEAVLSARHGTE